MKIGIRAHDMERVPFEELVQNISKKGFFCAQLALQKAIYEFNTQTEAMTTGMAFHIKDIFAQNKVDIAVLGCYLNLTNPIEEERKQILEVYKTHIRFASLLGCGMVGTETGAVNPMYAFEEANHSEAALCSFIESMKIILDYAEKMGVIIGMEPVYHHIVCNLERTRKVLDEINSPNLQIIFDPINLLNSSNYKSQDEIIRGAFELFGKEIGAIHVKDFKVEDERIVDTPVGKGLFHYDTLLKLIKIHKPYIHVLIENTQPDNAIFSREYIEKIYNEIQI